MKRILVLLIPFIIPIFYLNAYNVRNVNSRDGLSNSAVIYLLQDSERYLWIGTYDGLNKYNGTDVEVYKPSINNKHSISGNVIRKIAESKNNYLWILTKTGLDKYSKKNDRVEAHFSDFREDSFISVDNKGNVFVLTQAGRIYWYDFVENKFNEAGIPNPELYKNSGKFIIDLNNTIWIANNGIIKRFVISYSNNSKPVLTPLDNFKHQEYIIYVFYDKGSLIFIDRKRDLYVVRPHGMEYIKNISSVISEYGDITSIIFDNQDILIAFRVNGLIKLNHKKEYEVEKLPVNIGVFALLKDDAQDVIWVGTDGQGVYGLMKEEYVFDGINLNELPINKQRPIRAIYTDIHNNLWLGTKGNGIINIKDYDNASKSNRKNIEHFTTQNGLSNDAVFAFEMSKRNNVLWIGSEGPHLNYYSYDDKKIHRLENNNQIRFVSVHSLLETSDSILWVAASHSLLKVNTQKHGNKLRVKNIRKYEFDVKNKEKFNQIFSISQENDSIMWLGVRGNGVIRLNYVNGSYRLVTFDEKGIAPMNDILSICLAKNGSKWFGSSYGINKVKELPNGQFDYQNFNESDGLPNNTIHGILENNDGKLWLSTNNGVVLFDPGEKTFRSFNQRTGLKVIEYSDNAYYRYEQKPTYFFGGIDGVVWVRQEEKINKNFVPPVYFTRIRIFNEEFNINDFLVEKGEQNHLQLKHNQDFFSVSFIANDFINGIHGKYSYQLENFSETWLNANRREAQFTNIPPGKYVLKVKYNGGNAVENQIASLNITILPPWYLSIYAKILYGIAVIGLMFLLYQYIRRKYEGKKKKIEQHLDQKYKEEMYESKLRFLTNITHEFCTPLTLIYTPSERILNYEGSDSFIKKYASTIKSNAEKLNNLVQEIIDFRRIETGNKVYKIERCNINNICTEIAESFTDLVEENHVSFSLNIASTIIWNLDQSCFVKILNNLISNAFKYTPENGFISITVYTEKDELILKVYNTGKGIDEKDIPYMFNRYSVLDNVESNSIRGLSSRNGLGLAICKSMVDMLGGSIDVKSEVGKYAEFIVKLPAAALPKTESVAVKKSTVNISDSNKQNKQSVIQDGYKIEIEERASGNRKNRSSILIIDDNEDILAILNEILSDEYKIIIAKDGNEGFDKLINMTPELVITDVMMPNFDGISLTKKLKENPHTKHIPLVILSAKTAINDKIVGIESGADAYVNKPFDTQYLKTVIKHLIEKNKSLKEYYNSSVSSYDYLNGQLLAKEDRDFVKSAIDIIEKNINNSEFSPEDMADNLQVSMRSLYRRFKDLELLSPKDFIKEQRITYAEKLIIKTNLTIQEIMYSTGFTTRSHFYKEFMKRYNQSPKEYRQSHNNGTNN